MSDLKKKIRDKMNTPQLWALATITEDGKPWVRYVTPIMDENMIIWVGTFAASRKVGHIEKNPEVHLTVGVTSMETAESYLQIQGRAEVLTDAATKKAAWSDLLKGAFTGPDDPNYNVIKITPYRIEYQGMGMVPPEVWEA
ncbi:MAG: pyridoxamine 5'-phosphate oxidase family protein [Planctomycetota bacterium]|jgi:general stress protein 26